MGVIGNQKYQIEARKSKSIDIVVKVLGSLFFFSLILIFSTSLLSYIVRIIQVFVSNLSKSYIFLICNGILVFVVKNSGSKADSNEDNLMKISGGSSEKFELPAEMKVEVAEELVVMEIKELEPIIDETVVMVEQEKQEQKQVEQEQEQEQEHEDEEEEDEMSTEELNKKCEEFIRKMKQNIKLESQQLRCYYA